MLSLVQYTRRAGKKTLLRSRDVIINSPHYCQADIIGSNSSLHVMRSFSDAPKQSTKVKKKAKKASKNTDDSRSQKDLDLMIAALDAKPVLTEPPISEEEKARRMEIGKNYVRGRFRQHNEIDHDLNCKIKLKSHAMNMLPKNSMIREEAMKTDDTAAPLWRNIAVWTPPIEGFDPSQFVEKEE